MASGDSPSVSGEQMMRQYRQSRRRRNLLLVSIGGFCILLSLVACCLGTSGLSPQRVIMGLWEGTLSTKEINILTMLRLPRIVMALLAGAGLGVAGAAMQAITGNSMASPFTTGISNAAAFGAATVILFGGIPLYLQETYTVIAAFTMALLCATLVYGLSSIRGLGAETLVLVGIAINYFFNALNAAMQFIANEQQLSAIVNWTFGSLTGAGWRQIAIVAVLLVLTLPPLFFKASDLNLMAANGDETAKALGVNVGRVRILCGISIALIAAGIVSFTGIIGFVGLVAPHLARMVAGFSYKDVLPFSALLGMALVLTADTVGRWAFSPVTIPVGIVVSFVGVPLFVALILQGRREEAR